MSEAVAVSWVLSSTRLLGHASAAMTLDIYAGLFADDLDIVAANLDLGARVASADWLRTNGAESDDAGGS